MTSIPPIAAAPAPRIAEPSRDAEFRQAAKEFEATFIAQMLSQAGLGKTVGANAGFGGEAFSALLVEKYAEQIADRGGFGLADAVYEQLKRRDLGDAAADRA